MSYNKAMLGKVRSLDYEKGVGEIVASNGVYFFTINDISSDGVLSKGDLVKFRAELVQNTKKAFFVNKLNRENQKINYNFQVEKKYTFKRND